MIIVSGVAGGTELSGTIYEQGEQAPNFRGSPDDNAPFVWICDEFYQVESGGSTQQIADREIQIAFESPIPRGLETKEEAIKVAKGHIKTQFARIGIPEEEVNIEVKTEPQLPS